VMEEAFDAILLFRFYFIRINLFVFPLLSYIYYS
jgi:hypothetical protein